MDAVNGGERDARGILFDLDNTLMDRDATFRSFCTAMTGEFMAHLDEAEREAAAEDMIVRDADGYRDKDGYFAELSRELPWSRPLSPEEIRAYYDRTYTGHFAVMEKAEQVLEDCRNRGLRLGLVTNGKTALQNGKIDRLGLRRYFDAIVISEEAGIAKPDPGIYSFALRKLGVEADRTLFVGDHPVNDIQGAWDAGIPAVWLRRRHGWDERLTARPFAVIDRLAELPEAVGAWLTPKLKS
ncbi:HAD family hydrolase [Paenibacillus spiritus]|uniref:HAD family hydrolase n=1 Tax=Paenibacillus spiritus TaxID=2496557 RepID=A0A5J5GER0_9BACL|nr:HAD family hydrolase [Paenibacillus spiritus]KAA9006480.1 HAD family hydrolase [Paenibacillus spiritus]